GQYLTTDFPVLSAGPTPRTPLDRWSFFIEGLVREPMTWTWDEFTALPARDWTVDISCVTKWTKLDMRWRGGSVGAILSEAARLPGGPRLPHPGRPVARRALQRRLTDEPDRVAPRHRHRGP